VQIDDIDIATLDLAGLRSKLAFVPQDSVLFVSLHNALIGTMSLIIFPAGIPA
jgi:ABC-type transport system involved in Fe-S cluster assembly fused permease/ATPase subunit